MAVQARQPVIVARERTAIGWIRALGARVCGAAAEMHPAKLALAGYLSYIMLGWLLLSLPLAQRIPSLKAVDTLFTATSAVSTTGLLTISLTDSFSGFGQAVVLVLIQLGGIGYMTFGSFVALSRKSDLSAVRASVGKAVFSLPESFRIDKFIRSVIGFTFVIETIGAAALYVIFRSEGVEGAAWSAVFHSVSAFCTAGFSLYNDSFTAFSGHFWVNAVIAALSYLGAIGFIVCVDFWRMATGKITAMTLTSKIILWFTFWLSLAGTALVFISEPSSASLPLEERLLTSFFQAMTAMTTVGFNTVGIGALSRATMLLLMVLMIVGASPSGTGGGLKTTTVSAIVGVGRSALFGLRAVRFWKREIPIERVLTATASLGFYIVFLIGGTYLLELTETFSLGETMFEAASALGTVGLSTGITPSLSSVGKIIITVLMFCGRLGPLTFGMALFLRSGPPCSDADLAV